MFVQWLYCLCALHGASVYAAVKVAQNSKWLQRQCGHSSTPINVDSNMDEGNESKPELPSASGVENAQITEEVESVIPKRYTKLTQKAKKVFLQR